MAFCHLSYGNIAVLLMAASHDEREAFTDSLSEREQRHESVSLEKLRRQRTRKRREGGKKRRRVGLELKSGRRLPLWQPEVRLSRQLQLSSRVFLLDFYISINKPTQDI
ncbi:hypothetical protein ILYODFUR_028587 [Ilyodon furcidens]|uniref:Uncharacterized protein n=1 Tax=Ilyodon furcidens TaxID=33524 RepID=A0ABV0V7K5_9TELE